MSDDETLEAALDELDDHALQQVVNDALARRRAATPSRSELGLAEARRRFGDNTNSGRSQR